MVRVMVTMRSIRDPDTGELRDSISRDWTAYLDRIDVTAVPVPNDTVDPSATVAALSPDILLLTNGEDLGSHSPRDRTEEQLVETAIEQGIPILGVCRGHQFLNQHYGGDVVDLGEQLGADHTHGGTDHSVRILDSPPASPLPERLSINSYHDMGVTPSHVAADLEPFAVSEDGVVEGLYHPDRPILSIQWHPERPLPNRPPVDRLITEFLNSTLTW
jgi:putative glutamine amidotransferase